MSLGPTHRYFTSLPVATDGVLPGLPPMTRTRPRPTERSIVLGCGLSDTGADRSRKNRWRSALSPPATYRFMVGTVSGEGTPDAQRAARERVQGWRNDSRVGGD